MRSYETGRKMISENEEADPEDASRELLEQLKRIDVDSNGGRPPPFRTRLAKACETLHIKAILGHVGLLVSLSIYCAVGGLVSSYMFHKKNIYIGTILWYAHYRCLFFL